MFLLVALGLLSQGCSQGLVGWSCQAPEYSAAMNIHVRSEKHVPEPLQGIGNGGVQDDVHRNTHVIQRPGHGQAGLVWAALCHDHTELNALHAPVPLVKALESIVRQTE